MFADTKHNNSNCLGLWLQENTLPIFLGYLRRLVGLRFAPADKVKPKDKPDVPFNKNNNIMAAEGPK
jgi:hypothetical protein